MRQVNIHAAKTHLSRLVDDVAAGEEVVIAKAGVAVCRLVPLQGAPLEPRRLGGYSECWPREAMEAYNRTINEDRSIDLAIEADFYGEEPPR